MYRAAQYSNLFTKLWFLMCLFMSKWNNSCGSCTAGTVAIQRWHNGLKPSKAVNHSHLWMSGHTEWSAEQREERRPTLSATFFFIRHRILHFTDLSMLSYCLIPLTFLTLVTTFRFYFSWIVNLVFVFNMSSSNLYHSSFTAFLYL